MIGLCVFVRKSLYIVAHHQTSGPCTTRFLAEYSPVRPVSLPKYFVHLCSLTVCGVWHAGPKSVCGEITYIMLDRCNALGLCARDGIVPTEIPESKPSLYWLVNLESANKTLGFGLGDRAKSITL